MIAVNERENDNDNEDMSDYELIVKDTGIGMSPEYLPHVFESFTREKTSTVNKIQGTGLGMAISKHIIDIMNGKIDVESELGVGTTFTIELPMKLAHKEDVFTIEGKELDKSEKNFEGLRLLLAEDNDINAEIAGFVLKEAKFIVDRVENGEQAVNMIKEKPADYYSAVLMDVQMPVMNGYDATKAIRGLEDSKRADIPIIAMTANTFEEDKKNAFDAGMNAHVAKPLEVEVLLDTLSEIIKD